MTFSKAKIKKSISSIALLPLVLLALALSLIGRWATWLVVKLQAVELRIVSWSADFPGTSEKDLEERERLPDLDEIVVAISFFPELWVERFRMRLENSKAGEKAIREGEDRRLYAVLKPTKEENLQRVRNVFQAMTPKQFAHVQSTLKMGIRF